jgi:hypothetical protein
MMQWAELQQLYVSIGAIMPQKVYLYEEDGNRSLCSHIMRKTSD